MVWCGVVWCNVMWCGVVWCNVVLCGVLPWQQAKNYKLMAVQNKWLPVSDRKRRCVFCGLMYETARKRE